MGNCCNLVPPEHPLLDKQKTKSIEYSYIFPDRYRKQKSLQSIKKTNIANVDHNSIPTVDSKNKLEVAEAESTKNIQIEQDTTDIKHKDENKTLKNNTVKINDNNADVAKNVISNQCGARGSIERMENIDQDIANQDSKISVNQWTPEQKQHGTDENYKQWLCNKINNEDWRTDMSISSSENDANDLTEQTQYNEYEVHMFDEMKRFYHIDETKKRIIACKLKKEYSCKQNSQNDLPLPWKIKHQNSSNSIKKKQHEKSLRNKSMLPIITKSKPASLETESSSLKSHENATTNYNFKKTGMILHNNFERKTSDLGKSGNVTKESIEAKMSTILQLKTKEDILGESQNEECCSGIGVAQTLMEKCECFLRIQLVLHAYYWLKRGSNADMIEEKECDNNAIIDMIQTEQYGHQELFNDFLHIKKIHIDKDNNNQNECRDHDEDERDKFCDIGKFLCQYFERLFPCKDVLKCCSFRHSNKQDEDLKYDEKTNIYFDNLAIDKETKDVVFRRECDKIHGYFIHSNAKHRTNQEQINEEQQQQMDKLAKYLGRIHRHSSINDEEKKHTSNKKAYIGKKEDDIWLRAITPENEQDEDAIYRDLIENIGVFRWQNPHGFIAGQNRAISHYKPRFKNPKEEALFNPYSRLSADSWNQTVAKSKIFQQSWAGKKIRTKQKGYYDDQVTKQKAQWEEKDEINIKEVVTFKLYTDFDKLQFELKKCFRYEKSEVPNVYRHQNKKVPNIYRQISEQNRINLKNRLECFYNWRGQLIIALNKFGQKLNEESNRILYHGVNKKMLIKPSQTFAFNGPLSTSSSYHVARTFATAKGMVLKITSHFPRLNYCNAFDVSSLSDYPEEDEWLIGFMYVRLLEVRTRTLIDNAASLKDVVKKVPISSWSRQAFFAIHLFKEQILSMNEHLQRILAQCFKVNRYECCKKNAKYENQYNYFENWGMNEMIDTFCKAYHSKQGYLKKQISAVNNPNVITENSQQDVDNFNALCPMFWNKFNEFRVQPQRVKFDMISEHLKRFFMDEIEEKENEENANKSKKEWRISWDEITTVYPCVREIHFLNQYKLSDCVLEDFLKHIKDEQNKIVKVVFLYYNYKKVNKKNQPSNTKIFQDPDTLNSDLLKELEKLKWKLKHGNNGKSGYKIRIYHLN